MNLVMTSRKDSLSTQFPKTAPSRKNIITAVTLGEGRDSREGGREGGREGKEGESKGGRGSSTITFIPLSLSLYCSGMQNILYST